MDGVLDATSPNSGGATPRRIVKTLKQPLACVTQLVPLDGGESGRQANLLARLPAASIPSEASVSEVRSELCSVAYEEPVEDSTSSFFDHRRIRHGGKVNSSMSRSRASRTVNGSRARPRRSFRSVSSREVEESILSYSDEPVFYHCDSEASSGSGATEGSTYSMSYTAISESVPSCSLTVLADPGKSTSGGWAGRFRKNNNNTNANANTNNNNHTSNNNNNNNNNGSARKESESFGSIFGPGGIDPYNGVSLNSHASQQHQSHGRDSSSSQFAAAARGAAGGHRKTTPAAATAAATAATSTSAAAAERGEGRLTSPNQQYQESYASIKSPIEFKNTISPSMELPVAKDDDAPPGGVSAGDTTALPDDRPYPLNSNSSRHNSGELGESAAAAAEQQQQQQRQMVQKVKLLERVGRGTFGDVYRAEDCDTGKIIAVKEIVVPHDFTKDVEKQLAALESEIRVMRRLHHPHVVTYLGANREGNSLRIYMEFVDGGTVGSMLVRDGALPEEKTRNYTAQLLEGLEYLHASHILHRDLKGDNLFLTEQDELKLGDFGQSKELADTLITQSVQGTPSFMSPEMIACSGYSFEADVWSVGCCVIQMLTGKPPFSNLDNQMAVMFAIISSKIDEQIPQDVSEGAKDFIRMCTKTNIKDRWSATQLRQHPWLLGTTKEAGRAAPTATDNATTAAAAAKASGSAAAAAASGTRKGGAKRAKDAVGQTADVGATTMATTTSNTTTTTTKTASPTTNKPPRSILLDTAALSKTNAHDDGKRASGEAAYQYSFNGDTPDNEAGGNTSSNLSSTKAESPATRGRHGGNRHGGRLSRTARGQDSAAASAAGGALAGAANTPRLSPTVPPQPSPGGRRPPRVRSGAAHSAKEGGSTSPPPTESAAIAVDTSVNDSQGRSSPSHAGATQRPHRPAQAPTESSPRHRSAMANTATATAAAPPAGAVEGGGGKRRNGSNANSNNTAARTLNTPVSGRAGASPSHPRSGSRHTGSAIQRGASPGNQTSRATPNAPVTKPRVPSTSRPSSHLPKK